MLTLFILSYTLGAVVTYGALFAYFQMKWMSKDDYYNDLFMALFGGITWPVSNVVSFLMWGRKPFQSGLKFY